jgi:pSer/pThr/pTyr-binding forkhead associated (FHA) protein
MVDAIEIETRDGLRRFTLERARMTIGRLPGNDVVLPYTQISRHHAEVRRRGEDWWILDLGSTNGLIMNGRQIKEYLLHHGDRIQLSPSISLRFISGNAQSGRTIDSTPETPRIMLPPKPRQPMPDPETLDPFERSVVEVATGIAMPLPRRHGEITPPPMSEGTRPIVPPPSDFPAETPPLTNDDIDAWLLDGTPQAATPHAVAPPPPGSHDVPFQTPYARPKPTPAAPRKPLLYTCPTCSERTAPDSPYCWSCRQSIAQPCRVCQLYLLPIQQKCPRCDTPNHNAVRR